MLLLLLETATKVCSVALSKDNQLIAIKSDNNGNKHSELLTVFIQDVFRENSIELKALDAVAVSMGPGSYTGLRIGVSAAKGLCYALNKPLIGIGTLHSMANQLSASLNDGESLLCPMIDARRMEVYTTVYDARMNVIKAVSAEIIDESSFEDLLKDKRMIFFGDGAEKCKKILSHIPNAVFMDDFIVSAKGMMNLATKAFNEKRFEDVAYFEPFYLKDFVGTKA